MTAFRAVGPILLMVIFSATSAVAQSTDHNNYFGLTAHTDGHGDLVADALEQLDQELMMESMTSRRQLGGRGGYIGYGAMGRNTVPCNQRGQSYYNCNSHQKANPYTRGCTKATKCARSNR